MKILISSLQVSQGASKGHLHPAIELGLALQQRGHEVALLPLPSPLSIEDKKQIQNCGFEIIEPPVLPVGLPFPPEQLAQLAKDPLTTPQAYESFLVLPLEYQFENVVQKIKDYAPDIVAYDVLVYAAPLAARQLNIPDIGYCAGLKLIAPSTLTEIYQTVRQKLAKNVDNFLTKYSLSANFHHLELLSSTYQLVFVPEEFVSETEPPLNTICAGSLPISKKRCEAVTTNFFKNERKNIILSFGSVLDPANYPTITNIIIDLANKFNCNLIVSSQQPKFFPSSDNITIAEYLPLPELLKKAVIFIHHGGANTFSEALTIGVPQILIPLTTDQPIQAELLNRAQAGIAIYPNMVTTKNMSAAFQQLLNENDPIYQRIKAVKQLFSYSKGASTACDIIENITINKK